jgi:plasmid stability protein
MIQKGDIMKSLTLHALDDQLASHIRRRANELSLSMNELAKRILAEGLGIKAESASPRREMFADFCGIWTENDLEEFRSSTKDMSRVDQEDWK